MGMGETTWAGRQNKKRWDMGEILGTGYGLVCLLPS